MNSNQFPILIVGAGPVGLSLALSLARAGIQAEVFEADEELNTQIRASTFHPKTLELFETWGVVDDVIKHGYKVNQLQYWERASRTIIADFDYQVIAKDTKYPYRLQCPQHIATRVLKPAVEVTEFGKVHMGHKLIDFVDCGTHVRARFETKNGIVEKDGSYLCGADGTHSTVRKQLNIGFQGKTYEDRFLLIGSDLNTNDLLPNAAQVCYVFDPQEWVIILNLPDIVRVVFRMQNDEDETIAMQEENLRKRISNFFGEVPDYKVKTTQLYRVHQRVADTFRVGRVVLVGDSAHNNNPSGGMGMNSGIHDAANLTEKLERIRNGEADSILDDYSTERRKYAIESVQLYSDQQYKNMAMTSDEERVKRNESLAEIANDPAKAREYLLKASMLEERI
ncbi:MAG: FAD-dependent monooxygenase [Anaerolineales bacterium]|nr:FAD-dependent monooxygenase [Anaerolineales bacterium]